jgi:MazG family protein
MAMESLERLLRIMARLRDPEGGCPWDREQTFASIAPYTIEEAYEVADAIQRDDPGGLLGELGDLLFQVVFHARMAEERGLFAFDDVARAIGNKLVRRHPHVFAGARVESAEALREAWEAHKAAERRERAGDAPPGYLDGVSLALPALVRAAKLQKRAARAGFDWTEVAGVIDKLVEEAEELRIACREESAERQEAELGDLLFSCVNLARHLGVDAETALRHANTRFERRFHRMEALLASEGIGLDRATIEEMEARWVRAKAEEATARRESAAPAPAGDEPGGHGESPLSSSSSNGSGGGLPS